MWYKSPKWRVNEALGHANLPFCVQHVPVPHLLSSLAISYQVIAQLQMAHSVELRVLLVTKLVILPEQGKLAHKQLSVHSRNEAVHLHSGSGPSDQFRQIVSAHRQAQ